MKLISGLPTKNKLSASGIYFIQNTVNSKVYIGSAVDFSKRWSLHRRQLSGGNHANRYLLRAYKKHPNSFIFGVLQYCDRNELLNLEQFYCDLFSSYKRNSGYNIRTVVSSNLGYKVSESVKNKISNTMLGRKQSADHAQKQCEARRGRKNTIENIELQSRLKSKYSDDQLKRIIEDISKGLKSRDIKRIHNITNKTYFKLKHRTGYKYYFNGINHNPPQIT